MRRADMVRHVGAAGPKRLRRASRAILRRLVLHFGIEFGPEQDNYH